MYGLNCTETCRCKNGATCDISSGFCLCDKGWVGIECGNRMCAPNYYGENCTKTCECNDQNTEMYVLHDFLYFCMFFFFNFYYNFSILYYFLIKGAILGRAIALVSLVGPRIIAIDRVPS